MNVFYRRLTPLAMAIGLALALTSLAAAQSAATTAAAIHQDGFIPLTYNPNTGDLEFVLSPQRLQDKFLRFTGLDAGVGSLTGGGDRGTIGPTAVCHFERVGNRVLVVQENAGYRAVEGSPELQHSVAYSFPTAVLAALPVRSEDASGNLTVDANPLVVADTTGFANQLRGGVPRIPPTPGSAGRGNAPPASWRLDPTRSGVVMDHTHAFPINTETEALLTFTADNGRVSTAADDGIVTVRLHQSFVQLPDDGYSPLEFDPRVGFFTETFEDFSQPFDKSLTRHLVDRWRLVKKDPNAAVSDPVKPLTFYLDQAIPEPMRGAIRTGVLWWNAAFLQAGISNAIEVKDLPLGADPNDFRYPTILWTNREGRGWSVGQSQADPRTGEILHAVMQLDSHRMRTVHNYWDALVPSSGDALAGGVRDAALDTFSVFDQMDPLLTEQQAMVQRIALLACHEMGHVLGLEHNFLASTYGRGSVMDYFAPRITVRPDGTADLADAYMQGVGSYDKVAIEWGYSQSPTGATPQQDNARRQAIVQRMIKNGTIWGDSNDARWASYDDGPDPVTWLRTVMPVRDALLKQYSARMLRTGDPDWLLADRFALVYMFHQYGLLSALNVIGGARIPPALAGDGQAPVTVWPAAGQRDALALELKALAPAELDIPPALWQQLSPLESQDQVEGVERFRSSSGYVFDAYDGAQAITDIVAGGLLDPARLERLETMRHEDPAMMSAADVITALLRQAFPATPVAAPRLQQLQQIVQSGVADDLMDLAADATTPIPVQAAAWVGIRQLQSNVNAAAARGDAMAIRLQQQLTLFLRDPKQFAPARRPSPAPVGPPVGGSNN